MHTPAADVGGGGGEVVKVAGSVALGEGDNRLFQRTKHQHHPLMGGGEGRARKRGDGGRGTRCGDRWCDARQGGLRGAQEGVVPHVGG